MAQEQLRIILFPKMLDEVVADGDHARVCENVVQPSFGLQIGFVRWSIQSDAWCMFYRTSLLQGWGKESDGGQGFRKGARST